MRHRHATSRTAAELQCSIILVSLALDDNAEDGIGEAVDGKGRRCSMWRSGDVSKRSSCCRGGRIRIRSRGL
jgi:hypothetical protein